MENEALRTLADRVLQARLEFVRPSDEPCGITCTTFNEHGQCPVCGRLEPLPGDKGLLREMPLGSPTVSYHGLDPVEIDYLRERGL